MLLLVLGNIIGLVIGALLGYFYGLYKVLTSNVLKDSIYKELEEGTYGQPKGKATFLEPISDKEKFDKATNIGDIL